jgi:hypothetical protein
MADWDKLTPRQQAAAVATRKLGGHTSVAEGQRVQNLAARGQAFEECCQWLAAHGWFEASDALRAVCFEEGD